MGTLIDSSIFVAAERGKLDLNDVLSKHREEAVAIAAVTASELLHGVHRAADPRIRDRREAFVESVLATFPVIPFDLVVARVHAGIWAQLAAKGTPVGERDLFIGATAIALRYQLATRDVRSFPKIPGLTVIRC